MLVSHVRKVIFTFNVVPDPLLGKLYFLEWLSDDIFRSSDGIPLLLAGLVSIDIFQALLRGTASANRSGEREINCEFHY